MIFQKWDPDNEWQDIELTEAEFKEKFSWLKPGYMPLNWRLKPDDGQ